MRNYTEILVEIEPKKINHYYTSFEKKPMYKMHKAAG